MPERLISISKKQHDSIQNLTNAIKGNQATLSTVANTILMSIDEDLGQVGVIGAVCRDGVYSLAIEVPDIAPKVETPSETPAQAHAG